MDPLKEPNADQRSWANNMFGTFNALRLEGFSEPQALSIIGTMMAAAVASYHRPEDES